MLSKTKSLLDKISFWVSGIFSPFVILPVVMTVFSWKLTASFEDFWLFLAISALFMMIVPGAYIAWQVKHKKISDLHIKKREERSGVFVVFILGNLITIALYLLMGAPVRLTGLALLALLSAGIAGIITLRWKISIHLVALSTTAVAYALLVKTPYAWATLGFIPLVIWARVYRKRHTLAQSIAGALLGGVLSLIFYRIFLIYS